METTRLVAAPKKRRVNKEEIWGWTLSSIPLIGFVIFGLIPMVFALMMAFMSIRGLKIDSFAHFIGFENFKTVLTDPIFFKALVNTLYAALSLPITLVLSLIVAILLNQNIKAKKLFRTIFFIPYVCSMVAVSLMWKWIFNYNFGVLNTIMDSLGIERVNWLGNAATLMPYMILMNVWSGMGFNIILFTAALTNVNRAYYEAAEIDGAGAWKKFVHITLPAISPTTFYLLIMGLIGALQEFTRFQVMTGDGSPNNAGLTVVFYLYNYIYGAPSSGGGRYPINVGLASSMALLLAALIIGITILNFKLSKKWVSYD